VLTRQQESVWRKRPALWPDKWILHHDCAHMQDVLSVLEFMAEISITKMDQQSSFTFAPHKFWLVSQLKRMPQRGKDILTFLASNTA
jgi:hypothetical protein